ncbi:MAG TPA: 3-deoxy-manno-octulosonate cytidylyltransferase [Thermoanaerobaculia bacterium]|nr:3-deoxy-manno-octulosonate cytidylyltransferase [Thermoanaerobaculia bacterium]
MNSIIVIPARWASTRFPGKPLAPIAGRSLIQRVWERGISSRRAAQTWVATDDQRILRHVESFGGRVVMTPEAESGSDRIAAAIDSIEKSEKTSFDLVINLQGDEPLIDMESVDRAIAVLEEDVGVDIVTLAAPLQAAEELDDPDIVKVVADLAGNALYFSRSAIPHGGLDIALRHVGIYGYRASVLRAYARLPRSPLEIAERLEQLRALENGYRIRLVRTEGFHQGVDRPGDIARIESELARLRLH